MYTYIDIYIWDPPETRLLEMFSTGEISAEKLAVASCAVLHCVALSDGVRRQGIAHKVMAYDKSQSAFQRVRSAQVMAYDDRA